MKSLCIALAILLPLGPLPVAAQRRSPTPWEWKPRPTPTPRPPRKSPYGKARATPTPEPGQVEGEKGFGYKLVDQVGEDFVLVSWRYDAANYAGTHREAMVTVRFLDAGGYEVDSDTMWAKVNAGESRTITNRAMLKTSVWLLVASAEAELEWND
jgi:hypothetical protein